MSKTIDLDIPTTAAERAAQADAARDPDRFRKALEEISALRGTMVGVSVAIQIADTALRLPDLYTRERETCLIQSFLFTSTPLC